MFPFKERNIEHVIKTEETVKGAQNFGENEMYLL